VPQALCLGRSERGSRQLQVLVNSASRALPGKGIRTLPITVRQLPLRRPVEQYLPARYGDVFAARGPRREARYDFALPEAPGSSLRESALMESGNERNEWPQRRLAKAKVAVSNPVFRSKVHRGPAGQPAGLSFFCSARCASRA